MTPHIEAEKKDISKLVLMPGDPVRASYIAKNFLTDYKLVNGIRGMTAYTGYYKDVLVTIFPSGMGIPSMGIYSYELFKFYDVDVIIRIGSMGAYDENLQLNEVVLVNKAYSSSSYTKELISTYEEFTYPHQDIIDLIKKTSTYLNVSLKEGAIHCTECFYNNNNSFNGYLGAEMESTALFANAKFLNKKCATLLTVSDLIYDKEISLSADDRATGLNEMIKLALEALINYK